LSTERVRILVLFGINIVLHMLWSPLFFNLRRPDWALIEVPFLWLSIVALMFGLAPLPRRQAGYSRRTCFG
jgi:translocator protein